ncbi:glycosyltransferase [Acuticoccus sp.]|uniref:glycosyltransferase n=1 Tax=Acuticoccus sp. TaxID=1904378 RepID=UPI003B528E74
MRIAFVGHAFHRRTRSSGFFLDILRRLGTVTELVSSPDAIGLADDPIVAHYFEASYDLWVFYQTEYVAARLIPHRLRNAVLVPMEDGVHALPDDHLRQFVGCRFVTFCRALHERLQRLDQRSFAFQYWPEPAPPIERTFDRGSWSAFFWERRPRDVPNLASVLAQCRALGIGRLHVHAAPDVAADGPAAGYAGRNRVAGVELTTSTWFEDRARYDELAGAPQFVFAPRLREGIGLPILEAMARGQVVLAPDLPTANEVVGHLASGILYDPARPAALPELTAERTAELAVAARRKAAFGRREWEEDVARLTSVLLDDGRRWPDGDVAAHLGVRLRRAARGRRSGQPRGSPPA